MDMEHRGKNSKSQQNGKYTQKLFKMEKRPKVKSKMKLTIGSTSTVTECYKCAVITNAKRKKSSKENRNKRKHNIQSGKTSNDAI